MAAEPKKNRTGVFMDLTFTGPGLTAMEMAAIRAVLQMMEPMALP